MVTPIIIKKIKIKNYENLDDATSLMKDRNINGNHEAFKHIINMNVSPLCKSVREILTAEFKIRKKRKMQEAINCFLYLCCTCSLLFLLLLLQFLPSSL